MTPFDKVYDYFFNSITEDMYVTMSEEETREDAFTFLKKAIVKFRYPKKDIKKYDEILEEFQADLDDEECYILALYMILEWLSRQMATVRLTEMQYTGSDLKALNTKNQAMTLEKIFHHFKRETEEQLRYYQRHTRERFSLAGKSAIK